MGVANQRSSGGFAAAFVVLLALALIVKFFWWIVGVAALVGAFFVIRGVVRKIHDRQLEAAQRDAELARRADQQHRWTIGGDSRGVYGPAGADAMRSVSLPPPRIDTDEPPHDFPQIAAVAYTTEELATLIEDKPPCWRWAVFVSVLVQRRAPLQERLHDSALGFTTDTGESLVYGPEVALFVIAVMDDISALTDQVGNFMLTPAFMAMFGDPGDESTADADGILHTAERLMDYHDRFLTLSERCRAVSVPSRYRELMRDCARLADIPLQGYKQFIDDFVTRVNEMPQLLRYASGTVAVDPVILHMEVDDKLLKRISKQINKIPMH